MVSVGTPARSLSSVRSRISEGGVSSINWTKGSMASEYWTRCGMGMVSFSLSVIFGFVAFTLSINAAPLDRRRPLLVQRKKGQQAVLFIFLMILPRHDHLCQLRTAPQ